MSNLRAQQRGKTCAYLLSFGGWGSLLCHLGFHKWYDGPDQFVTVEPRHTALRLEPGLYRTVWCSRLSCERRIWTPVVITFHKEEA
jgi:hypothetical protein